MASLQRYTDRRVLITGAGSNDYVRGAVSGLGLINLGAGVAELAGLFAPRRKP